MAYVSGKGTASTSVIARLTEIGRDASEAYRAWRLYRRTLEELQRLSLRELNDLGLNRSMLRQAALEAAYGKAH
ncbi:MAG: DUF1127 domain-containing protein [Roseicyclus sp.]